MQRSSVSRRNILAGTTAAATAAVSGCSRILAPTAAFQPWEPDAGTWPLQWYDSKNTRHNPHATPPTSDPIVRRTLEETNAGWPAGIAVGVDHLVAFGDSGLRVFNSAGERIQWQLDEPTYAGFPPPTAGYESDLFTVSRDSREYLDGSTVRGLSLGDEAIETMFEIEITPSVSEIAPAAVVPTESSVFVGTGHVVGAYDPTSGEEQWSGDYGRTVTLGESRAYATLNNEVRAIESTSGSDRVFGSSTRTGWEAETDGFYGISQPAALGDGRLVVGSVEQDWDGDLPSFLTCFDAKTGDRCWDPIPFDGVTNTPAVTDAVAYVSSQSSNREVGVVAAVDLETGTTRWKRALEWGASGTVTTGDGIGLVCGRNGNRSTGFVQAFDLENGDPLWTHETDDQVHRVAAVGERVYVSMEDEIRVLA